MGAGNSRCSEDGNRETVRPSGLELEDEEEARRRWKNGGVEEFVNFLTEKEEKWKQQIVKIAVIGLSGCGKSTFVNTIRRLTASHSSAAKTGVTETTLNPTRYPFPGCPQVELWEVPGVNTPNFPKETYLQKIGFDSYDFFLVLSSERFRQDDAWLGNEATKRDKKFFYVRTKVDQDVRNETDEYPDQSEETVLQSIRSNIEENLKKYDFNHKPLIFLVGRHFTKYDICKLKDQIKKDCPDIKRDQLVIAFNAVTKQETEEKVKVMPKGQWRRAAAAAITNCLPIPGTKIAVDKNAVKRELGFYYEQLGLSGEGLDRTARSSGCDRELLEEVAEMAYPREQLDPASIERELIEVAESSIVILLIAALGYAFFTPVIIASYATVLTAFQQSLDKMKKAAVIVAEAAVKKSIEAESSQVT